MLVEEKCRSARREFAPEPTGGAAPTVTSIPIPVAGRSGSAVATERHFEPSEGPDLEAASLVISGGRGIGSDDK